MSLNNDKKARIIKEVYTLSPKELISTSQVKSSVQNAYEKIWITKDQQQNAKFVQTYLMCRNPSCAKKLDGICNFINLRMKYYILHLNNILKYDK